MKNAKNTRKVSKVKDYPTYLKWAGWIGAFLIIFGYYLNANMYTSSWLVWIFGNALVGVYSISIKAYSTAAMSFIVMIFNFYGLMNWLN